MTASSNAMGILPRNGPGKILLVVFSLLGTVLIFYRLNASTPFVFSGPLSESLQIIKRCPNHTDNPLEREGPNIPSIIHQIWKTADISTYSTETEPSHNLWKDTFNPLNYTVKLWTDDDISNLIKIRYSWLLSTYESYLYNIQRADLARLAVIHSEGGIYADLDVYPHETSQIQCLQNLGLLNIFAPAFGLSGLSNHFFMAERGSPFLLWRLYEAKRRGGTASRHILLPYLKVFWNTGPLMVTAAYREYAWLYGGQMRRSVGLLDPWYAKKVVGHAAGRSWHGADRRMLNYLADHVWKTVFMGVLALAALLGVVFAAKIYLGRYKGRGRIACRRLSGTDER